MLARGIFFFVLTLAAVMGFSYWFAKSQPETLKSAAIVVVKTLFCVAVTVTLVFYFVYLF